MAFSNGFFRMSLRPSELEQSSPTRAQPFNSFSARLFVRVSLSSAVERYSEDHGAGLSTDIARPTAAEQARAAISRASKTEQVRAASAGSRFLGLPKDFSVSLFPCFFISIFLEFLCFLEPLGSTFLEFAYLLNCSQVF